MFHIELDHLTSLKIFLHSPKVQKSQSSRLNKALISLGFPLIGLNTHLGGGGDAMFHGWICGAWLVLRWPKTFFILQPSRQTTSDPTKKKSQNPPFLHLTHRTDLVSSFNYRFQFVFSEGCSFLAILRAWSWVRSPRATVRSLSSLFFEASS